VLLLHLGFGEDKERAIAVLREKQRFWCWFKQNSNTNKRGIETEAVYKLYIYKQIILKWTLM